ncbi:MAG: hypothetical protein M3164_04950 [Actinomycetota bacterium]|nr:hypothetical protein [Actinomycetota bacterium]
MRIIPRPRGRKKVARQLDGLRGTSRKQLDELRGLSRKQLQELRGMSQSAMQRMRREAENQKPEKAKAKPKKRRRPSFGTRLLTYGVASGVGIWLARAMANDRPRPTSISSASSGPTSTRSPS